MLGTLFTVPSSSAIITGAGAYSSTYFTELLPVAYLVVGVVVAVLAVRWLGKTVKGGAGRLFGGKRGRRRGRRR